MVYLKELAVSHSVLLYSGLAPICPVNGKVICALSYRDFLTRHRCYRDNGTSGLHGNHTLSDLLQINFLE